MADARALLGTMRPHQWLKNGFVLAGLLFGHAWGSPAMRRAGLLATGAFCLVASAIYAMNDVVDRDRDARDPVKARRPVAAGRLSPRAALFLGAGAGVAGLALAAAAGGIVLPLVAGYVALNVAYTLALKHVVILDVFVLALGFILRILAGTAGIGIPPSHWLLVCGLMLALFLGFAKRYHELVAVGDAQGAPRAVLTRYPPRLLDNLMVVTASGTVMSYTLYAVSAETTRLHGTSHMIYTLPFVLYGIFRYMYLLHAAGRGADTAADLLGDPPLVAAVLLWVGAVLWLTA